MRKISFAILLILLLAGVSYAGRFGDSTSTTTGTASITTSASQVIVGTGSNTAAGNANLAFDGTDLSVGGDKVCLADGTNCVAATSMDASGINWVDWYNLDLRTVNWTDYEGLQGGSINWIDADLINSNAPTGINWIDLDPILGDVTAASISVPAGESSTESLVIGTSPNQITVSAAGQISADGTAGINWVDFPQVKEVGINWTDIQTLACTGPGSMVNCKQLTYVAENPSTEQVIWKNLTGMTARILKIDAVAAAPSGVAGLPLLDCSSTGDCTSPGTCGINWNDCTEIEKIDIDTLTMTHGAINWNEIDIGAMGGINWADIAPMHNIGINWIDVTSPTEIRLTLWNWLFGTGN